MVVRVGRSLAWLLPLSLALSGCGSPAIVGAPKPLQTADQVLQSVQPYLAPDVVKTWQGLPADQQQGYRDQVVYARIAAVDARFKQFLADLGVETKNFAIGSDLAVIGLNTASVLSGTETAKDVFSGLSGALLGARSSIDKNAFYDQTVPALVTQMVASRRATLAGIMTKLQSPNYSLLEALVDLEAYEFAGSFTGALQQISQKAGAQYQTADAQIQALADTRYQAVDVAPAQVQARGTLLQQIQGLNDTQAVTAAKQASQLSGFATTAQQAAQMGLSPTNGDNARRLLRLFLTDATSSSGLLSQLQAAVTAATQP